MSEPVIDLPATAGLESIPAILAAPKPKRGKTARAVLTPVASAPVAEPVSAPPAAVSAEPVYEEPVMATVIENTTADTTTDTAAHTAAHRAQAMFGDMSERAKGAMEQGTRMFEELNSFNKGNVEALVESGKIAVAALQTMSQDAAAKLRTQFEEATATARTMAAVKSPTEFVKMQSDYVRQQMDAMMAETSRSTEAMMKLAGEVVQPISNRVAVAVEKFKTAA